MPNLAALAVALTVALTFCVHVFVGGKYVARPLLADTRLPPASKWLNYYCWHLVSLMLAAIAVFFAWAAFVTPPRIIIAGFVVLFGAFSGLSFLIARKGNIPPLRFPSTSLFLLSAILTLADLLTYGMRTS